MPRDARLTEGVLALQRAFAGHVLSVRGSLTNTTAEGAPNVNRLVLIGHDNDAIEAGREVELAQKVPMPPIAAFFNSLSLPMRVIYDTNADSYTVFLTVPRGTPPVAGRVVLRWPAQEIPAEPQLQVLAAPSYLTFDLQTAQADAGDRIAIARFPFMPVEVEFGDLRVPEGQFWYTGGLLEATVPVGAWTAKIRVATADGGKYRSNQNFALNHNIP